MQKQITLNPGQSGVVTFSVIPNAAGIYQATLDGLSGSFEALFKFETILDPSVNFGGVSLPAGLKDYDCFASAELSAALGLYYGNSGQATTYTFEHCLTKDSGVTPIGSASRSVGATTLITGGGLFITLPGQLGTYDTMLRVYRNGVLTGQYPYLGPITVIPKGVSHFSYTKPSLTVTWDSWWPGYIYGVSDTITNMGSTTETRNVILWLRRNNDGECSYAKVWYRKHEFTLTLAPGKSYNYSHQPKHDVNDPDWEWLGMVGGDNFLAQLRDSDSGVSPKSDIKVAT